MEEESNSFNMIHKLLLHLEDSLLCKFNLEFKTGMSTALSLPLFESIILKKFSYLPIWLK